MTTPPSCPNAPNPSPNGPAQQPDLRFRLSAVAICSGLLMFLYEVAKSVIFPHLTMWESHAITIALTSAIATFAVRTVAGRVAAAAKLKLTLARREADFVDATRQSQYLMEAVIADVPAAILACDATGRFFLHNRAADDLFAIGTATDSTSGASTPKELAVDVFLPDAVTPVAPEDRPMLRALRGDLVSDTEFVLVKVSGEAQTVRSSARRLVGQNGECLGAVSITQDVSQRKKLERELANAQKLETIGHMAAGVAHEINTPVQFVSDNVQFVRTAMTDVTAVIQAYRDLQHAVESSGDVASAARRASEAEKAADLDFIMENAPPALDSSLEGLGRIATIVRSMKEFAHPDHADKTSADLNQAIKSTLVIAHNEYKYVAEVETDFGELPPVPCYLGEINQVVLNLLVNAAHAISDVVKDSGAMGKITVRTRLDADQVEIAIGDTGTGIPEAAREKVFDPFFTTKEVGRGTGQGLAIAHSVIVKKHGGTLRFETESGKGTTFFIRLPTGEPASDSGVEQVAA
jgi:signal transduction histidine kinase